MQPEEFADMDHPEGWLDPHRHGMYSARKLILEPVHEEVGPHPAILWSAWRLMEGACNGEGP
jgi:hypothetical protein